MASEFPVVYARRSRQLRLSKLAQLPEAEWREILDTDQRTARERLANGD